MGVLNQLMKFLFQKYHQKGMGFFETSEKEIRFVIYTKKDSDYY